VSTSLLTTATAPSRVPLTEPGQVAVGLGAGVTNQGMVVQATGALASGLEVEQVARISVGRDRGLANARCQAPRRDAWFIGSSATLLDRTFLILANVDDTPATVDISVFGHAGALDPRPGQGVTVAPHSRTTIALDSLAPGVVDAVVHVKSRQGRVVAALRQARSNGPHPYGLDYVPQSLPPATSVVVPGIPKGPGFRGLLIGNPGTDDTTVSVRVATGDDEFVPASMNEIAVEAGHSVRVDLTSLTDGSPVTAMVTSSGSGVVASAFLVDQQQFPRDLVHDLAYGGSGLPLSGSALVTDLVIDRPTESTLVLSAPETAASVTITPIRVLGSGSAPAPRRLAIPAGRTVTFRLTAFFPPGTRARLAVEVRPDADSGPVYAARYLRERGAHGVLSTLLTLQGPAQLVPRPSAYRDDAAGYP
jgi:hypothetical protein